MVIKRDEAKALCTDTEYELYEASLKGKVQEWSATELRDLIGRARRARDKYRDLAHRQSREQRGKASPRGQSPAQGNDRTQMKVDLFNQVLEDLEARRDEIDE